MAQHKGRTFTREEIYDHVYGLEGNALYSTITEFIRTIRKNAKNTIEIRSNGMGRRIQMGIIRKKDTAQRTDQIYAHFELQPDRDHGFICLVNMIGMNAGLFYPANYNEIEAESLSPGFNRLNR
ncbi:hypothetical protein PO124_12545 [Bacillus licheniformis]|nr:hypothetical protein [Bacillus licheniformis]